MKKKITLGLLLLLVVAACKKENIGGGSEKKPPYVEKKPDDVEKSIITWSDIENAYSGSFTVPKASVGVKDQNFHYSKGAFCMLNKETIILEGHTYSQQVRQLQLPSSLKGDEAVPQGEWFDPTDGLLSTGETNSDYYVLGDMLAINDKIYFTKYAWYSANIDYDSFGYLQKDGSFSNGKTFGLWNADHELARNLRIGGYLSYAPKILKDKGVTFLAGQEGVWGEATGRWGPNLFAVKFDHEKPKGAEMEVVPLIVHPDKTKAPADWWIANKVTSMIWIETKTKHGVLALFTRGYGDTWYGEAKENTPPDPYGGSKGYHSTGKQLVAWIYDPEDLMKVYNNKLEPHLVKPVEEVVLADLKPGNKAGQETFKSFFKQIRGVRADMYDDRLIFIQGSSANLPKGFVVDF